jgi:signal transduction histidine kinase/ligand-binding sensor domain-containing protein/CheY-like chemotaxis protein
VRVVAAVALMACAAAAMTRVQAAPAAARPGVDSKRAGDTTAVIGTTAATGVARPIRFEHLGSREGLSQSTVMAVLQDSQGFMWFATENGLDRYDGYSMKVYRRDPSTPGSLASDFVWSIAEDSEGDLWMATLGGGVARWVRRLDRFVLYRHDPANPDSLGSDAVRSILVDAQGRVWAGTEKDGLASIDRRTGESRRYRGVGSGLPADGVFALHEDARGRIWVGTDAGVAVIDRTDARRPSIRAVPELAGLRVRSLASDSHGDLWIGTFDRGALRHRSGERGTLVLRHDPTRTNTLSSDHVRAVLEDRERRLWIATSRGLDLFDPRSGDVTRYAHDKTEPGSLRDSYAMSLHQDRAGILWVGTRAGGVSRWNPRSWQFGHTRTPSLRDVAVTGFADDGDDTVWVSTAGAGLVELSLSQRTERRRWHSASTDGRWRIADDRVMSVLRDRYRRLWVGTMGGGLELLDEQLGRRRTFKHTPGDAATIGADGVMTLFEARDGTIWAGTYGGGIARFDESARVFRVVAAGVGPDRRLSDPRASAIAEDPSGKLWVGTTGGGLNLVDPSSGLVHAYRHDRDVPATVGDDTIYALHVDAGGVLWIGTAGGGLSRAIGSADNPESLRFESWSTRHGLPSDVIYGIEPDATGRLWLSTNYGLARFDPADGSTQVLHDRHGLQAEEFNFAAHHRSSRGLLFFGGNEGFNVFDPGRVSLGGRPPPVVLTALEILNAPAQTPVPHYLLDRFSLGHRDTVATFEFAALDFAAPDRNRYAYRLDGFDPQWIEAGTVRRVSYTNLDPGQYTFEVRAAGADGVWNTQGLSLPVNVQYAPWASPAARVLYVLAAIFIVFALFGAQRRRLQRETRYSQRLAQTVEERTRELSARNRELEVLSQARSQFVARMSHELRTPMNGVIGMTEVLLNRPLEGAQRRCVEIIGRASASLVSIVDDILDLSKAEAGRMQIDVSPTDVDELVESVADTFAGRAMDKGVELVVDAPSAPQPLVLADAMRLRQVLGNLVGNAVKFTNRGHVVLAWESRRDTSGSVTATFVVRDTGVGIRPENLDRVFEPFSQEDASTQRRFGGTGLGLAIARELVELMGGRLTVASQPGQGTEFRFSLSLEPTQQRAATVTMPAALGIGRSALLIGPVGPQRTVLERHLVTWGMKVTTVEPDADAAESHGTFDVVLALRGGGAPLARVALERALATATRALIDVCDLAQATVPGEQDLPPGFAVEQLVRPLRVGELRRALAALSTSRAPASGARLEAPQPAVSVVSPKFAGTVLLVEDQAINRAVAGELLATLGFSVSMANDGHEALSALRSRTFRLVFMDCQMPLLDGLEATRRIRRGEAGDPCVPVVALTADATATARAACLAAGMDRVLTKPITRAALAALVADLLAQDPTQHEADAASTVDSTAGPAAAMADVSAERPLLDPQALELLRSLPGGAAASERVLGLYASGSRELMARLESAVSRGDLEQAARAAHAWKSYHGNVGAWRLERLCRDLEEAAAAGAQERAARLVRELCENYVDVASALSREFPGRAA